jgi:HK97 family phage major capsid protein
LATRVGLLEQRTSARTYSLPGVSQGRDKFSFGKAFHAISSGDWSGAGLEREVFDQMRKRAMSTDSGSGGYLVPVQAMSELIELLTAKSVVITLGARVLSNLTGAPVTWPKQTAGAVAYWVGENAAITASDLTVDQLSLTPKKVAALVKVSRELSVLSNPAVERVILNDLAGSLALAVDLAALRGSGSANQPLGIANTQNILTHAIGTDGGTFNFHAASAMEGKLDDANALKGRLGFVMHPKVKRLLKRERIAQFSGDTGGAYIIAPMLSDARLAEVLGYGFGTSTQLPVNLTKGGSSDCSEVYFGNWEELFLAMWGGLELLASNVAGDANGGAFSSDQLWFRAIQRVDIGLRHVESFCLCSDARVSGA